MQCPESRMRSLTGKLGQEGSKPLLHEARCDTSTWDQLDWGLHRVDKKWQIWRIVWELSLTMTGLRLHQ